MWSLPLVLFVSPLMFLLIRKKQNKQQIPPTPPRLPIIGNLHQLGDLSHRSLWQLPKKYGPVMLLKLGAVPTVVISSAEAAKEVLKTNDLHACSRPLLAGTGRISYNYSDVSFTPYGDYWRKVPKICVLELCSARRVQSFLFIREEEVALLIGHHLCIFFSATPVYLSEKILSFTVNITCRAAFGKSFQEIRGFDGKRFEEVIREASAILASFSAGDFFPKDGWIIERLAGLLHSRLERSFRELDVLYRRVIDDHIKLEEEQEDIVGGPLKLWRDQAELGIIQLTHDHINATCSFSFSFFLY
uniref:Cytochrome P450 71B36-like n=1 Tax=Populus alba TaxID=43335 RepID=A0A4U5LSM1_POPAL|nr:cytochrome P450 71B36-like [Populus alba]